MSHKKRLVLLQLGSLDPSGYLKKGKEESRTNMKAKPSLKGVTLIPGEPSEQQILN